MNINSYKPAFLGIATITILISTSTIYTSLTCLHQPLLTERLLHTMSDKQLNRLPPLNKGLPETPRERAHVRVPRAVK